MCACAYIKPIEPRAVLTSKGVFQYDYLINCAGLYADKIAQDFGAEIVASIESRGFIFAGSISFELGLPFVLARKPGKLPNETFKKDFDLEYGSTSIEIQKNTMVNESDRVVIVDDLVATGGTAIACAELLTENFNVRRENILILAVIDLPDLGGSNLIADQGYGIETIVSYTS